MKPTAGSTYSGVIEQYHDVTGFILAARPEKIRVIGQAPIVATNVFDMVSDGQTFRIYIPSKNKFLVGPASLVRPSSKPIENLRPQHVVDALFWPEFPAGATVLFEQFNAPPERYYILTLLRQSDGQAQPEIARKIWFDRADLSVSRIQVYGPGGRLDSDIEYADWEPVTLDSSPGAAPNQSAEAALRFPRTIRIWRVQDDYRLDISITKLTLNQPISDERFVLAQPPGAELVNVGEQTPGAQP